MNVARFNHSSCTLGDRLYVFFGYDNQKNTLSSIEHIYAETWSTEDNIGWCLINFDQGVLPERPLVAPIGD